MLEQNMWNDEISNLTNDVKLELATESSNALPSTSKNQDILVLKTETKGR